jgi:DegV family protein with EDD domain
MRIITDSTSDISQELIDLYNIEILPLTVTMGDRHYKDGVDINTESLFSYVKAFGELPETSAAPVEAFTEMFTGTDEIVYISLSSKLSESYNNASQAVQVLGAADRIHLIDSLNLSAGIGLLVVRAAELRNLGLSADEIEQHIRGMIPKVRIAVLIDTLEYLHKGGRCSAVTNIVSNVLKIRPILQVNPEGTLGIREKIGGPRNKAIQALIEGFKRDVQNLDQRRVFITHTGCQSDAYYLRGELRAVGQPDEIHIMTAGAVISSHTGPNGIAIMYMLK